MNRYSGNIVDNNFGDIVDSHIVWVEVFEQNHVDQILLERHPFIISRFTGYSLLAQELCSINVAMNIPAVHMIHLDARQLLNRRLNLSRLATQQVQKRPDLCHAGTLL